MRRRQDSGDAPRYEVPPARFDFTAGALGRRQATRRTNRLVAVAALAAAGAFAAAGAQDLAAADRLEDELASVQAQEQTLQDSLADNDDIDVVVPEADLHSHVDQREQAAASALADTVDYQRYLAALESLEGGGITVDEAGIPEDAQEVVTLEGEIPAVSDLKVLENLIDADEALERMGDAGYTSSGGELIYDVEVTASPEIFEPMTIDAYLPEGG